MQMEWQTLIQRDIDLVTDSDVDGMLAAPDREQRNRSAHCTSIALNYLQQLSQPKPLQSPRLLCPFY